MLGGGFRVVWGCEIWGWGCTGAVGGWVGDSIVIVVVFGGAIYGGGGIGEGSVEGPLGLIFLQDGGLVGESLAVLGLWRRKLIRWSVAALGSVG